MALLVLVGCSSEVDEDKENVSDETTDLEISNEEKEEGSSDIHEIIRIKEGKFYPNEIKVDKGTSLELEINNEDAQERIVSIESYDEQTLIKEGNKASFYIEADEEGSFNIDLKETQYDGKLIVE